MTARTQRGFTQIAGPSPSATLNQTLDANGNRLSLSASIGGTADFVDNYTYDDLERLTSVTQGSQTGGDAVAPKRVNFSYDEDSQWSTISQYADLAGTEQVATATYNYDYDGNLTGLSYAQANSTGLPSYTWTYNAAGLVTQMTSPDGTVSDTYDADNQLTQASSSNPLLAESHTFDSNGNRTDSGDSTGADNQVTSDGTFNYTYDNEGNRISRTRISGNYATDYKTLYTYDNRNRLTSVTFEDNNNSVTKTVTYMYDPFNHWIGETVSVPGQAVQQTRFVYDGSQIALEFDMTGSGNLSAGNLSHRYLWGPAADQLVADEAVTSLTSPGTVDWLLADGQGTIRDIATYNVQTNQTTIANHRVFGAWGELESQTNSAVECLFGYTGRPFDSAASLQNNGERWYDSVTGRWLSEDPAGFAAGDPNLTRYVGNGPANATDPSGLADGGTGSPYNNGNGCVGCQGYALMSAGPDGQGGDAEDIDGGGPAEGDVMFVVPTGGGGAQNTLALAGTRPAPHGFVMFGARFVGAVGRERGGVLGLVACLGPRGEGSHYGCKLWCGRWRGHRNRHGLSCWGRGWRCVNGGRWNSSRGGCWRGGRFCCRYGPRRSHRRDSRVSDPARRGSRTPAWRSGGWWPGDRRLRGGIRHGRRGTPPTRPNSLPQCALCRLRLAPQGGQLLAVRQPQWMWRPRKARRASMRPQLMHGKGRAVPRGASPWCGGRGGSGRGERSGGRSLPVARRRDGRGNADGTNKRLSAARSGARD